MTHNQAVVGAVHSDGPRCKGRLVLADGAAVVCRHKRIVVHHVGKHVLQDNGNNTGVHIYYSFQLDRHTTYYIISLNAFTTQDPIL